MQLYEEMKHQSTWNNEQFLADHLRRKGLLHKIKVFPYVMYTARSVHDDSPTWCSGYYESTVGHYVKYETEFRTANAYAAIIRSRADWERGAWKQFDPAAVAFPLDSVPRRVLSVLLGSLYGALSAFCRPGRVGRFMRFCKGMLRSTFRRLAGGHVVTEIQFAKVRRTSSSSKNFASYQAAISGSTSGILAQPADALLSPLARKQTMVPRNNAAVDWETHHFES
jgi:hypothetical protein